MIHSNLKNNFLPLTVCLVANLQHPSWFIYHQVNVPRPCLITVEIFQNKSQQALGHVELCKP